MPMAGFCSKGAYNFIQSFIHSFFIPDNSRQCIEHLHIVPITDLVKKIRDRFPYNWVGKALNKEMNNKEINMDYGVRSDKNRGGKVAGKGEDHEGLIF